MSTKSFYDLDYIIEINEERVKQYASGNEKVLQRLTNIIIIYSALTIFLVPIVQDIFLGDIKHWLFYICFALFAVLFIISLIFTVRLVIPKELANLENPRRYYTDYRLQYEQMDPVPSEAEIVKLLNASYITELEAAIDVNQRVFESNSSFYYRAMLYSLLSAMPYLVCLGFHISKKEDKVQKVQLVRSVKDSSLHKN